MTVFKTGDKVTVPGDHIGTVTKVDHKQKLPYFVSFDLNKIDKTRPFTLLYKASEMTIVGEER